MPIAVGLDLVGVDEVEEAIRAHGARYVGRIYTEGEQRDCGSDPRRLATRFAAKEATMKALERSDEPVPWRSIEIRTESGRPALELTGAAAELARAHGVVGLSLSLATEGQLASALVLAERAA